jgi:nucleoside phosphorylase
VLLVAATTIELAAFSAVESLVCGVGPVEAAAATARRLARVPATDAILHIGIAGARDFEPGTLVLGSEAIYGDLAGQRTSVELVDRVAPDARMLELAQSALPEARVLPIGTAARVGGADAQAEVEAMEGFAVLRAAAEAGVPALELRAVSNRFSDARDEWQIAEALEALARAVPRLLEALDA